MLINPKSVHFVIYYSIQSLANKFILLFWLVIWGSVIRRFASQRVRQSRGLPVRRFGVVLREIFGLANLRRLTGGPSENLQTGGPSENLRTGELWTGGPPENVRTGEPSDWLTLGLADLRTG